MLLSSIDLDAAGKQQGCLQVPYSHNLGDWANVMLPITVIANGDGRYRGWKNRIATSNGASYCVRHERKLLEIVDAKKLFCECFETIVRSATTP